jgi:hypothetical protein
MENSNARQYKYIIPLARNRESVLMRLTGNLPGGKNTAAQREMEHEMDEFMPKGATPCRQ